MVNNKVGDGGEDAVAKGRALVDSLMKVRTLFVTSMHHLQFSWDF